MKATIKDDFMQRIATEEAWKSLSEDFAWTEALLEKNCDKVDWKEISGNLFNDNSISATAFYEKYKERIPMAKLQDSDLWKKIVEERTKQLKSDILS